MSAAPAYRLRILAVVLVSLFATLFARLWYLQVLNSDQFQAVATNNVTRVVNVQAPRGRILDVNHRVLVDNRQTTAVTVDVNTLEEQLPDADARLEMLTRLAVLINGSAGQELVKVTDLQDRIVRGADTPYDAALLALDVDSSLLVYLGEHRDEFPGVEVIQTTVRDYPYGTLAAHVLGYVGSINLTELEARNGRFARQRATADEAGGDDAPLDPSDASLKVYAPSDEIGKTGIEAIFEDDLRGIPGQRVYEVDVNGDIIRERLDLRRDPIPGSDVVLTIDIDLQALVEAELIDALEMARRQDKPDPADPDFLAPAGAAVILDPRDGSVRAMASYPTYDPASFIGGISSVEFDALRSPGAHAPILNRAIQAAYAPGSTFKLVTAYAGMRTGLLDAIYPRGWREAIEHGEEYLMRSCTEGAVAIDTCIFRNSEEGPYVGINLPRSLTVSSDSYYYRIGEEFFVRGDFDSEEVQLAAREFGFGRPSGIALLTEGAGLVPDAALYEQRHADLPEVFPRGNWLPGDSVNLAIGQGEMLATPLQIANAYATFANGGTLHAPNIVARVERPDGEVVREFAPRVAGTVDLPPEIRDPIMEGLLGVTADPAGTAYDAFNLPGENPDAFVDFDLARWPVAGKTGTAEKNDKADFAIFSGFGPTPNPGLGVALDAVPAYAMTVVLEEAGFASRTAAPMVARVFQHVANDTVPPAPTAFELSLCDGWLFDQEQALADEAAGVTTTTTPTTTTTLPTVTAPPSTGTPADGTGSPTGVATTTTTAPPPTTTVPLISDARLAGICGVPDDGEEDS